MVWVWAWVCLICVLSVWVSSVGIRYKNAFFICMATKFEFAYIFTLLAYFPLRLFNGVVYNEKMFLVEYRCV